MPKRSTHTYVSEENQDVAQLLVYYCLYCGQTALINGAYQRHPAFPSPAAARLASLGDCRAWFAADRLCVADVALDALPKRKTDGSLVLETKQHMYKVANPRCEAVDHLRCDTQLAALCPLPSLSSASPNRARR